MNGLSLCSGIGGLDLAIRLATPDYRAVCHVEIEAYAAAVLVARMEEGRLDQAPVWDDLTTFDGHPWRGVVDIVSAGYPCQPFSVAGLRRGADDPRHLWPHVARIIRECEPSTVFLENVGGHLRLGFEQVAGELRRLGYRVAAGLFTAEEAGAPHRRERLFALAYREGRGVIRARHREAQARNRREDVERGSEVMADATGPRRNDSGQYDGGSSPLPTRPVELGAELGDARSWESEQSARDAHRHGQDGPPDEHSGSGCALGDSDLSGPQGRSVCGCECPGELPAWPPGPTGDWSGVPGWLWPSVADTPRKPADRRQAGSVDRDGIGPPDAQEGRDEPDAGSTDAGADSGRRQQATTQPGVRGVADGATPRMDRLRALGNGVVPAQAAYAFNILRGELEMPEPLRGKVKEAVR